MTRQYQRGKRTRRISTCRENKMMMTAALRRGHMAGAVHRKTDFTLWAGSTALAFLKGKKP